LLYIGRVYTGNIVKLAVQLFTGLAIGSTAGAKGVAGYAGLLRAIFAVPVVWFKAFLTFSRSACALIQQRP